VACPSEVSGTKGKLQSDCTVQVGVEARGKARWEVAEKVAVTNPPRVIEVMPRQGFTPEHLTLLRLDSPTVPAAHVVPRPARFASTLLFRFRFRVWPVARPSSPFCARFPTAFVSFRIARRPPMSRNIPRWFLTHGNLITGDTIKCPGDEGDSRSECRRRYEPRQDATARSTQRGLCPV